MRETEIPKNQKSRRRVNRAGVKKTHLVIITSPEDTHKKKDPTHPPKLRPASIRSRNKRTKLVSCMQARFFLAGLGILSERKGKKKDRELTRLDRN